MANDPLFEERLKKLEKLKELGVNPYPEKFNKTHTSAEALALGEKGVREVDDIKAGNKGDVSIAGRIVLYRSFGKLVFAHIQDDTGRLQIAFMVDNLDDKARQVVELLDMGDFIGVTGEMFRTKHGEVSLLVDNLTFLGKALRPLPEKFHGIQNQEAIYRQRYLDLIMNRETRERFNLRSLLIRKLREFYWQKGYTEIETPVLENTSSGAISKPFTTHHNALDIDVYLRIAGGELWLKEAVIGGFEKVFEIGKVFRNEGIDPSHLQEFTMVEHYAAYWSYEDNMKFTEEMFEFLITELFGTTKVSIAGRDGKIAEIDFKAPWPREDYMKLIEKDCGIDVSAYSDEKTLLKAIKEKGIEIDGAEKLGYGNLIDHLYKKVTRPKLQQPTFVIKHPKDTKPLARLNDDNSAICDTFQLLINGWEVVNAYSELVDPADQRSRFEHQVAAKAKGDEEAMDLNEAFILALEHGAPPMSGLGMGIDRLVTLLTEQDNLKDMVMFPIMKPLGS